MTIRAKFKVTRLSQLEGGASEVVMQPVTQTNPENAQFFKYTPYGELKMGTINAEVAAQLTPGKEFYLDFTPA